MIAKILLDILFVTFEMIKVKVFYGEAKTQTFHSKYVTRVFLTWTAEQPLHTFYILHEDIICGR